MSTRSEIVVKKNNVVKGCIYHHSDGYPEHIICDDLNVLASNREVVPTLKQISKHHGTQDPECAMPPGSQGDLDYQYEVEEADEEWSPPKKVKIIKRSCVMKGHDKQGNFKFSCTKKKIFEGTLDQAHKKFCKGKE